jgi:hypothetical protein
MTSFKGQPELGDKKTLHKRKKLLKNVTWRDVIRAAVASDDEHVIKLGTQLNVWTQTDVM